MFHQQFLYIVIINCNIYYLIYKLQFQLICILKKKEKKNNKIEL